MSNGFGGRSIALLTPMAIGYCECQAHCVGQVQRKKGSEVGKEEAEDEPSTDKSHCLL